MTVKSGFSPCDPPEWSSRASGLGSREVPRAEGGVRSVAKCGGVR